MEGINQAKQTGFVVTMGQQAIHQIRFQEVLMARNRLQEMELKPRADVEQMEIEVIALMSRRCRADGDESQMYRACWVARGIPAVGTLNILKHKIGPKKPEPWNRETNREKEAYLLSSSLLASPVERRRITWEGQQREDEEQGRRGEEERTCLMMTLQASGVKRFPNMELDGQGRLLQRSL
ncbi:hypothetical protein LXL04_000745 [Taraxacum kok-saghyz]